MSKMTPQNPGPYGRYDIVPRGVEWPKFDDGSPVCFGDYAGGDGGRCGHVEAIRFTRGLFTLEFEEGEDWVDPYGISQSYGNDNPHRATCSKCGAHVMPDEITEFRANGEIAKLCHECAAAALVATGIAAKKPECHPCEEI